MPKVKLTKEASSLPEPRATSPFPGAAPNVFDPMIQFAMDPVPFVALRVRFPLPVWNVMLAEAPEIPIVRFVA